MLIKKFLKTLLYPLLMLPLVSCGTEMGDQIAAGGIIGTGEDEVEVSLEPSGVGGLIQNKKIVSIGAITALDGITVNGTRYDTSNALIIANGKTIENKKGALALGMVVEVKGTVRPDKTSGEAEVVTIDSMLEGPLTEVDITTSTFVIFGRTIQVSSDTVYEVTPIDEQAELPGLSDLLVESIYEVSGLGDSNGNVIATRIEQKEKKLEAHFEYSGIVENLNEGNKSFNIGTYEVSYSGATLKLLEGKALKEGDSVKIEGMASQDHPDTFVATEVKLKELKHDDMSDDDEYKVEGIIASVEGSTLELHYGGGKTGVIFGTFTKFKHGSMKDLVTGKKVEIEGFVLNGDLEAREISFKKDERDHHAKHDDHKD